MSKMVGIVGTVVLVCAVGLAASAYFGAYDVAADVPHTRFVYAFLETVRDRSIAKRARSVQVPENLADAARIEAGAGLYAEMCAGCHLAPGMEKTEISQGLYPRAPELFRGTDLTPAEEFWAVKHGVKMTGMAAWGPTHNDTLIWDMVAFLRKLPGLTAAQYENMVKSAPEDHDEIMKHQEESP